MIVLDASALIDAVLDQPAAPWVLDQIANTTEVCAPTHQPAEILSALTRLTRTGHLDTASARAAFDEAADLPQRLVSPTAVHLRRAFGLRERIRVVDSLYVVLADELGCPLVTTDRRLADADAPCEVHVPPQPPNTVTAESVPPPRNQ